MRSLGANPPVKLPRCAKTLGFTVLLATADEVME
jgi:hypothetical protein